MNTTVATTASPGHPAASRRQDGARGMNAAPLRALLWKEWRELRLALLAGVTIFALMPGGIGALYAIFDQHHQAFFGIATILFGGGGVLFAAVLAAQAICRDFGRAEGRFLLGLPVSSTQALAAKVICGLGVLLLVQLAVCLSDGLLLAAAHAVKPVVWEQDSSPLSTLGWIALASVAAYMLTLPAAAWTRNTFLAVMLGTFAVVFIILAPLVTHWLPTPGDMWNALLEVVAAGLGLPSENLPLGIQRRIDLLPFGVSIALGAIIVLAPFRLSFAVSASGLRRSSPRPVSTKSVIWVVALLSTGLVVAALNEIGVSAPISDARWYEINWSVNSYYGRLRAAATDTHVATIDFGARVRRYELTPDGRLGAEANLQIDIDNKRVSFTSTPFIFFDELGNLYFAAIRVAPTGPRDLEKFPGIVTWPELVIGAIRFSESRTAIIYRAPLVSHSDAPVRAAQVIDLAQHDGRLFIVTDQREGCSVRTWDNDHIKALSVFTLWPDHPLTLEWSCTTTWLGEVKLQFDFTGNAEWLSFARYYNPLYRAYGIGRKQTGQLVLAGFSGGVEISNPSLWIDRDDLVGQYPSHSHSGVAHLKTGMRAVSERSGLSLIDHAATDRGAVQPPVQGTFSRYRYSPLAWLFRVDRGTVTVIDAERICEANGSSVSVFNISDPVRPRRISHTVTAGVWDVLPVNGRLILNHGHGISVIRLSK